MASRKLTVDLGERSYPIVVGAGSLQQLAQFPQFENRQHVVVITDEQVADHYLTTVTQQLEKVSTRVDAITIPVGEPSKSVATLETLWSRLLELNTDRKSTIIALGGGVVGDLAGFAAASFARGIDFIQIPTSLLAQVDSSVGGKVGINLPAAKNMVGAFWQPKFVLVDPEVLTTLDEANYVSGMAEVVKYGVIMDAPFFQQLGDNVKQILGRDAEAMTDVIAKCCELKANVVREDETESTGRRAILNYGHTFGHAIENVYGYGKYLHGQAIAIGMQSAAHLAMEQGMVDEEFFKQQTELLNSLGLPLTIESGRETELVAAMHRDKKVVSGKLKLVLPTKIGDVQLVDAPDDASLARAFQTL